ncbi:potassium channel subfamily K member 5 isoform X1 [Gadus morhua]|uniref:Potassium channel subfamily K member 5-like n=1 Tax=Gadus morhua TaxID=8049 RepID=A0A8C4ZDC1_GADMO|nr:potassium channel subfamily K member 5-like isoform X1 [Gadus morhua]
MAEKGPLLTSCIIFYLSIGAAVFQILEESNWQLAKDRYVEEKELILKKYSLTKQDLEYILEVVSEAAGQGVTITGDRYRNSWDWPNSVVFAASIVTTIGYGNVAPKTAGGRVFCILYGLCGIPLCLVWISDLGSFFGDRAKRLSQVLIRKGLSVKKVQLICTALFLLWGLVMHLVMPPFVFMSLEGWSYLEGFYFSFITLTTVGFGDYVAGVNPNIDYPRLYRVCAEIWVYMGLAWLSLFFSWNVHMVVKAHKVLKKRRHRHKTHLDEEAYPPEHDLELRTPRPTVVDIFKFLEEGEDDDYSTVIKKIGEEGRVHLYHRGLSRSKSCNDLLQNMETLEGSPKRRRRLSVSEVVIDPAGREDAAASASQGGGAESEPLLDPRPAGGGAADDPDEWIFEACPEEPGSPPAPDAPQEAVPRPAGGETRFTISVVEEGSSGRDADDMG